MIKAGAVYLYHRSLGYYINFKRADYKHASSTRYDIAFHLQLSTYDLEQELIKKFNAHLYGNRFYFAREIDAQKAVEWINAQYIMIKLIG